MIHRIASRLRHSRACVSASVFAVIGVAALAACGSDPIADEGEEGANAARSGAIAYTEQNWSPAVRSRAYHAYEGSQIIPLSWFLALETAEGTKSFASQATKFGFLVSDASKKDNPHGLPLGFAVGTDEDTAALYGEKTWVGLTCTACHTAEVKIRGKNVRIDGGPNLVDLDAFQDALAASVSKTLADGAKLRRFARAVGGETADVEARLRKFGDWWTGRLARNAGVRHEGKAVHGPGRTDAVGGPANDMICKLEELGDAPLRAAFENPANCRDGGPYTAYPDVWDLGTEEFVQSSGNVHNILGRNMGQATGVYGRNWVERLPDGRPVFKSSAKVGDLHRAEADMQLLRAPSWRAMAKDGLVPALDEKKLERGGELYAAHCNGCHAIQPEFSAPDANGAQFWKVTVTAPEEIGTDPAFANFPKRTAVISELVKPAFVARFGEAAVGPGNVVSATMYRAFQIGAVIAGQMATMTPAEQAVTSECRDGRTQPKIGYKASALHGIVFTAPFLHNGSVPTLADLLRPASERPKTFYVGCRDYDLEKVGYACDARSENAFLVDTAAPMSGNAGHEYGTDLGDDDREALIEFIKGIEPPQRPAPAKGGACAP